MSIHNAHAMQNGREFKLLLLNCLTQKILPVTSIFSLEISLLTRINAAQKKLFIVLNTRTCTSHLPGKISTVEVCDATGDAMEILSRAHKNCLCFEHVFFNKGLLS